MGNLRRHYSVWLSGCIVLLLLIANLINLGADLGAMGAALKLMIGGPGLVYVVLFALLSAGLQIFTHLIAGRSVRALRLASSAHLRSSRGFPLRKSLRELLPVCRIPF